MIKPYGFFIFNLVIWNKVVLLTLMKYESVKISTEVVNKVRAHKVKSKIPISAFFEIAATEKLAKSKSKK